MPIYEYECQKCGHTLEALQKFSDKPLRECPECGKHQLKRLVSAPLFRLAGSGWYETDFKSEKEQKRNLVEKSEKESAPAGESKESVKESAPAAKETGSAPEPVKKSRTVVAKPAKTASARKSKPAAKKSSSARTRKR